MATSAFGKAFRAARESGDTEFEYEGKKYNTKLKEEDSGSTKSSTRAARPASTETRVEPKQTGTPDLPVTKSESSSESKPEKKTGIGPYNVGAGFGDYLNKTFTMEGREQAKKENKEKFGMKKGGAVSASRRGDGIAQRGKTRGKMC
jgi:hypothetical protein